MIREYSFNCPECDHDHLVEVDIHSWGHPGTPASFNYPGDPPEGPEFSFELPKRCEAEDDCKYRHEDFPAECESNFDEYVQERLAEPDDPPEPEPYWEDTTDYHMP